MNRHTDFIQYYNDFIQLFGEKEGIMKYQAMLKSYGLDETRSYASQHTRECINGVCESFGWTPEYIKLIKSDKDAKYYKVRALTATLSANKNDYTDLEELERSARTLTWRPLNLNHDPNKYLPFPENRVDWAEYEDRAVEAIIRIHNDQRGIQLAIENEDIVNPSIEGEPRGGFMAEDGRKVPKWYNFTALALLEKGVTLPGVPTTFGFEPLFLNEELGRSLVESLSVERGESLRLETHEKEEKIMDEPEQMSSNDEPKEELIEGQGIQGIDVCGQCKFFVDHQYTTETAPAVTGAPTDAEVTISSGAVGPGIGTCSVDGEYKTKQDPACTDGRPREQATDLDRVGGVESMNELTMKTQIAELEGELLRVTGERNKEIETTIKTTTKLGESEARLKRVRKDLAVVQENETRHKDEILALRERAETLKKDNTRLEIHGHGLEKDLELAKARVKSLEEGIELLEKSTAEAEDEKRRAVVRSSEEIEKRVQAQQQTRNAETARIRAVREAVELTEQLSIRTGELSESITKRSDAGKREFALQKENEELRKKDAKLVEELRELKKIIEKLKKKDFDIEISL